MFGRCLVVLRPKLAKIEPIRFQTGGYAAPGTEAQSEETKKKTSWKSISFLLSSYYHVILSINNLLLLITITLLSNTGTKYEIDETKREKLTVFGQYVAKCLPKFVQQVQVSELL